MPCWRATNDTDIPGAKVSCTIRAFSSADQRRRRCTDVITSNRSIFPVIDTGILLVLAKGYTLSGQFGGRFNRRHRAARALRRPRLAGWPAGAHRAGTGAAASERRHAGAV